MGQPDFAAGAPRLEPAGSELKPALRTMLSDYLVELGGMVGIDPARDATGEVAYRYFDAYWGEPARFPFAIRVGGALAGFCLLRDVGRRWQIAEFYVTPPCRRHGVGATAVEGIVAFCRAEGRHAEIEAGVLRQNRAALAFWHRQGFATVVEDWESYTTLRRLA